MALFVVTLYIKEKNSGLDKLSFSVKINIIQQVVPAAHCRDAFQAISYSTDIALRLFTNMILMSLLYTVNIPNITDF